MRRRVNNFGDLLGPLIVNEVVRRAGVPLKHSSKARLLSVGSIMHLARDGDVVWGTGVNGKVPAVLHQFSRLDVRAVRGPATRAFLVDMGIPTPETYGDPGLLLPRLFPGLLDVPKSTKQEVLVVPNLNEIDFYRHCGKALLDPRNSLEDCLAAIAASRFVIASSLHALVVADALGIPARALRPRREDPFKYQDYYEGTGRPGFEYASSVSDALRLGGEEQLAWDAERLSKAFPMDLFLGAD